MSLMNPDDEHVGFRLKEEKILLSADGPHRNVLKFKPPLCFTAQDADLAVEKIDLVLTGASPAPFAQSLSDTSLSPGRG